MTPTSNAFEPPSPAPTDLSSNQEENSSENPQVEIAEGDPYQSDSESFHTTTLESHPHPYIQTSTMSDPTSSNTLDFISPAYTINASLSKISINDKLTDSNYISWVISIQQALRSVGLQLYIKDESSMSGNKNFEIHCDCITNWILNSMDSTNANRMQSRIMVPDDENLKLIYSPQKLWEETRRHHAPCTEAARFRLETELDSFKQGYKISLTTHLDSFTALKDRLLLAGGKPTSE